MVGTSRAISLRMTATVSCKYSSFSRAMRSTPGINLSLHASSSHRVDSLQATHSGFKFNHFTEQLRTAQISAILRSSSTILQLEAFSGLPFFVMSLFRL
jgi:hypothetical protein